MDQVHELESTKANVDEVKEESVRWKIMSKSS